MQLARHDVYFEINCRDRDLYNYLFGSQGNESHPVSSCFCMNWNENFWGCIRGKHHCEQCTSNRRYLLCEATTIEVQSYFNYIRLNRRSTPQTRNFPHIRKLLKMTQETVEVLDQAIAIHRNQNLTLKTNMTATLSFTHRFT